MPLRCRRPRKGSGETFGSPPGNRGLDVSFLLAASSAEESFVDIDVPVWAWGALIGSSGHARRDLVAHQRATRDDPARALIESSMDLVRVGLRHRHRRRVTTGRHQANTSPVILIEKSLSVDNVFLGRHSAPSRSRCANQHRVAVLGIFGALILRAIFIGAGVSLISRFWCCSSGSVSS